MPAYARADVDTAALQNTAAFLTSIPEFMEQDMLDVAASYSEPLISQLGQEARPRGNDKYVWSNNKAANERARAWWFDKIRRGLMPTDGSHYIRQRQPPRGWNTDISIEASNIVFAVFNTWPGAKYVWGKLTGASYIGDYDTRNPTHASDGWPLAYPIVEQVFLFMVDDLLDKYNTRIENMHKNPRITRRRK